MIRVTNGSRLKPKRFAGVKDGDNFPAKIDDAHHNVGDSRERDRRDRADDFNDQVGIDAKSVFVNLENKNVLIHIGLHRDWTTLPAATGRAEIQIRYSTVCGSSMPGDCQRRSWQNLRLYRQIIQLMLLTRELEFTRFLSCDLISTGGRSPLPQNLQRHELIRCGREYPRQGSNL